MLRTFGIDRVIYGSDYSIGDPVADLGAAKSPGFSDAELAAVLYDNAAALLGWPGPPAPPGAQSSADMTCLTRV